jgi:hypothetical protein
MRITAVPLILCSTSLLGACGGGANHAPVLAPPADVAIELGDGLAVTLEASDADGDRLDFALMHAPEGAAVSGNELTWTPDAGQVGVHARCRCRTWKRPSINRWRSPPSPAILTATP